MNACHESRSPRERLALEKKKNPCSDETLILSHVNVILVACMSVCLWKEFAEGKKEKVTLSTTLL
jgi:hypothetical protein